MLETQTDRLLQSGLSRRTVLQAGTAGVVGSQFASLPLPAEEHPNSSAAKKSVIFIFLTGGISQTDTFDMKPQAPENVRGEFQPIATKTPGLQICEHLPQLAKQSDLYSLVRSIGTNSNGHELACHMLLTGRLDLPAGFSTRKVPSPNEWPTIPSLIKYALHGQTDLPPAAVLPQPSVNEVGRVRPGQYAGKMGSRWEAWHIDIAAKCALGNGACPNCFRFDEDTFEHGSKTIFDTPLTTLPTGGRGRLNHRVSLLENIERQRADLEQTKHVRKLGLHRQQALSVLTNPKTSAAFNVENADPKLVGRYGKNKFGLSLLMAKQLSEAGVRFVQVNLGKNSTWDTHRRNFINLKRNLLPYMDQAVSALLQDLKESGQLDSTLVVLTGEFGRTPKINKNSGRDHWGPVMTSLFAGGGVKGGNVIGATDKQSAYPVSDKQTPANLAATMFETLGIPRDAEWVDIDGRPHRIYHGSPISGLM
ncbi:MAG: DUF1501 domain-containing protein [Planctomycetaceae bacterium]